MNNSWDELIEFETRDLLVGYFKKNHNSQLNAWKASEIASNFIQGREYFESAKKAGFTVRPLLLYYGVLALTRALILTLQPKLSESMLKGAHGLKIKNWSHILKSKDFENLELQIREGSLSELLHVTGNINYLRAGTNVINWKGHLTPPSVNQMITLKEFFQFLPDLNSEFTKWTGHPLSHTVISSIKTELDIGRVTIKLNKYQVDERLVELLFPINFAVNRQILINENEVTVVYENLNWSPNISQKWHGSFDLGDICVVPVLQNDVGLNILSTMFAISYTFGMMARYYPSSWISLRRVEAGDKAYPIIQKTLSFIEEKYPLSVLDFLKHHHSFEKK
jgi:hypothetical protein